MAEDTQRQGLQELAERSGWQRRDMKRVDIYQKGDRSIEMLWAGEAFNGGTLYHEYHMQAHTRDSAKAESWLTKW